METIIDDQEPYLLERVFGPYPEQIDPLRYLYSQYLRPSGHTADLIKGWIEDNVRVWGLAPTTWAKRAGIAPSTINRFLDKEETGKNLSARTIETLSRVIQEEINGRVSEDWDDLEQSGDRTGVDPNMVDVVGYIGRDIWHTQRQSFEKVLNNNISPELRVPGPTYLGRYRFSAFIIRTDSYMPDFRMEDTLICAPVCRYPALLNNNNFVILIQNDNGKRWRPLLRQYALDPNGRRWLLPVGKSANLDEQAIFIDAHTPPSDYETKVTFVVVGMHRHLIKIDT